MNDKIKYVIYDISSYIRINNVTIDYLNYEKNLEFYYDEKTNILLIKKLPEIEYDNDKFMIFTSDILEIIRKCLGKYISLENVKIELDPLLVFAYSPDVVDFIKESSNFKLINRVLKRTDLTIESLNKKILNDKKKQDENSRKSERILEKRREIFGIKREDFNTIEEYKNSLNEKTVEYAQREYKRYSRHLHLCFEKYKNYLKSAFDENPDYINDLLYSKMLDKYEEYEWDSLPKKFKEDVLNILSDDEIKKIHLLKSENDPDLKAQKYENGEYEPMGSYDYTNMLVSFCFDEFEDHPIYKGDNEQLIFKMINLAVYISDLQNKVNYYQNIISNCGTAYMELKKDNILWGSIIELPYFFKFSYDSYYNGGKDIINSLIIKPGVDSIDLDNLICFSKYEKEGFGTYQFKWYHNASDKYENHKKIIEKFISEKYYYAERLIITIPESLNHSEIEKIVNFGIKYGFLINFICETQDVALYVRKYIILSELNQRKIQNSFIGNNGNIFVNVDPMYYRMYFTNLPSNKSMFHMYDYSSDYKYSRKDINSLSSLIVACIKINKDKNNGIINYEEIEEQLLGSYTDLKYEKFDIAPQIGAFIFDELLYQKASDVVVSNEINYSILNDELLKYNDNLNSNGNNIEFLEKIVQNEEYYRDRKIRSFFYDVRPVLEEIKKN